MSKLERLLAQYASYHRDRRNVFTHFFGIPMIVLSIIVLLSRIELFEVLSMPIHLSTLVAAGMSIYYLRLDLRLGTVMSTLLLGSVLISLPIAEMNVVVWLTTGMGLFGLGWIIQFYGHYFEGRKPAFLDDMIGLLIGPLFIVTELGFVLGLRKEIEAAIHRTAGQLR